MDQALRTAIDMNQHIWNGLSRDLKNVEPEEANWRPLPQANNINLIVRHLRIEAQWKLASLETGEPEPMEATESVMRFIDSIGFDFKQNLKELDEFPDPGERPDFYVDFDETGPYEAVVGAGECAGA